MKTNYFSFFGERKINNILHKEDLIIIQKVAKGTASEDEQKLVIKIIVEKICRLPHSSFNPDSQISSFNEGARWVGVMLAQCLISDIDDFKPKISTNK